uniref:CRISPR type III-associated protein domain-containing protein n=1 Tax=Pseudothermotoga hypogea TaxID=57487 RepID=A0A832I8B5_9THEM
MFSRLVCAFSFSLQLTPKTGLLVSAGGESIDPTLPDISFMRTNINGLNVPIIPGSSVKGPVRSFCESFLRGFADPQNKERYSCDLTNQPCGSKKGNKSKHSYKDSCLACRTFGMTSMASVIRFSDFYPVKDPLEIDERTLRELEKLIVPRTGIKINRSTGKVEAGALFEYESAFFPFYGSVVMKNPERWQVGLFFYALDAINSGLIRFGRSKSRGLGWVEAKVTKLEYFSPTGKLVFRKDVSDFEEFDWFEIAAGTCDITQNIETLKAHTQENFAVQLREAIGDVE